MDRIGLKINGKWCVLPNDVSITIEEHNPLFSDSGSFSYPIELSVSQNRELFKSIDHPHGVVRPQDLDGLPFEFWFDGILLLYGSIETDEDIDVEGDRCSINLVSGNGDFKSKIEGMQCTDVPLIGEILLGYSWPNILAYFNVGGQQIQEEIPIDEQRFMEYNNVNISEPYPVMPYCNVRVCYPRPDFKPTENDKNPYVVLDADRPWSGVCFYVAYFIDCLFAHLGYVVKENNMGKVDDMMRLAFFTTKCEYKYGKYGEMMPDIFSDKKYMQDIFIEIFSPTFQSWGYVYRKREIFATEKNFPETDISTVIDSLFSAFGLKIVVDESKKAVYIHYIRDILRDNEVMDVSMSVISQSVSYSKVDSVKMTFDGDKEDTAYNYDDYTNTVPFEDYQKIIQNIGPYDKSCYISKKTGNKYRIKIDKDAEEDGEKDKLNPSLFEVAQYADYVIGNQNSKNQEELKIFFTPAIENDVNYHNEKDGASNQQRLAMFVDEDMKDSSKIYRRDWYYFDFETAHWGVSIDWDYTRYENYDETTNEISPLRTRDSGFTLGIMRGPGSEAKTEVFIENYDGNGNSAWTTVVADYAFTSDTMDAYGNRYDYNGTVEGGVANQDNAISLKTHIQTAKDVGLKDENGNDIDWGIDTDAAKRGLADRFMSEYMHFLLHRKTVKMGVDTTMSQLRALSWFKQLRINNTVGRLKTRTYTITNSGVEGMAIELYTIN